MMDQHTIIDLTRDEEEEAGPARGAAAASVVQLAGTEGGPTPPAPATDRCLRMRVLAWVQVQVHVVRA